MTDHLNQNELQLALEENAKNLPRQRFEHFTSCNYCQEQYNIQYTVHNSLKKIKPVLAPERISQKVLSSIINASRQAMPKKKTDWVFLMALIILSAIGAWYLFNGQISTFITDYVPQIAPEKTVIVNNSNEFIDSLRNKINAMEINVKITGFNWRSLYVLFGFFAFIFYIVLDKKLNQLYKMRRT